jgi:hypothetical protein
MWKTILFVWLLWGLGFQFIVNAQQNHWPWGEVSNYPLIELNPVRWLDIQKEPDTEVLIVAHALASDRKTNLFLSRNNEGFVAEISVDNIQKMWPRLCSSFNPFFGNMYYCGYINGDEQIDFALQFYCGGNGLNADLNQVTFLLSNENGYEATTIETFGGGPDDHFLLIKNKPHFIMKSFGYENECTDGKPHSFWIYNLLEIKGGTLYLANQNEETFPKTIRFTEKPNFKETDMLTSSQKENMLLSSIKGLGMNKNRVPHCKEANP